MLNKPIMWLTQSQSALPRLIIRKFSERKSMLEAAELVITMRGQIHAGHLDTPNISLLLIFEQKAISEVFYCD